jgi:energy-coupling factor transporter transmembrane protein EcfT
MKKNISYINLILLYVLFVSLLLFLNKEYIPIGLISVSIFLAISLIFWIVSKILKNRKSKLFLSLVIISLLAILSFSFISYASQEITKKRANLIIQNLYKFKEDYGYYPFNLKKLVPKYLISIPNPTFNYSKCFEYNLIDSIHDNYDCKSCEFVLIYYGSLETEAYYSSKTSSWSYND